MRTRHIKILIFIYIFASLNVFAQTDCVDNIDFEMNRIDSLTAFIDNHNPSIMKLNYTTLLDSLVGEQIMIVEKQTFNTLCKYTLRTNKSGTKMDLKFIELYLSNDSLIKANVFYDHDYWKIFYYKHNLNISMLFFPHGMRISIIENGQKYVSIAILIQILKTNN